MTKTDDKKPLLDDLPDNVNSHQEDWSVKHSENLERSNHGSQEINYITEKQNQHETEPNDSGESNRSPFRWLVVPMCILYFGAYITSYITIQQYVYIKIQRDKFPNVTFNSSIPICKANESDPKYKTQTEVQKESAEWMSYFALATGIPAIFSNLILGSYTDRFGRKFLFFLPCIGVFIHIAVNAIGIYTDFALYWFIPACIFEGLTGQLYALLLVAFSYTADITRPGKERSFGIVLIELAIGVGIAGFSFASGFFIQNTGFFWPMLSAGIYVALTLVLVILLPETYPKEKRTKMSSPWEFLNNSFSLFFGKQNYGKRWMYNILMLIFIFSMFPVFGRSNVETLYQLNNPFCWDPKHVSWFVALRSAASQIVGMGLVKPLQYVLSDEAIAILGSLSFMAGFTTEGLAQSEDLIYASAAFGSLGMLTIPMVRAIMSKLTSADKQGAVFASIGCIETATNVVGTVLANVIYDKTIDVYKSLIFFVFVGCNLTSGILMIIFKVGSTRRRYYEPLEIRT